MRTCLLTLAATTALLAVTAPPAAAQPSEDIVADWNDDGSINTLDYTAFLNDWNADEPWADLNADGDWTSADVTLFSAVYSGNRLDDTAVVIYVPATGNFMEDTPLLQPWDVVGGSRLGPMVWDSFQLYNPGEIFEYAGDHPMNDSGECAWCDDPETDYWEIMPGQAVSIKSAFAGYYWEVFHPTVIRAGLHEVYLGDYVVLTSADDDFESESWDGADLNLRITYDTVLIGYPTNPYLQATEPSTTAGDFKRADGAVWNQTGVIPAYVDVAGFAIDTVSSTALGGGYYSLDRPSGLPASSALIVADIINEPYTTTPQKNDPHPLKWDEDDAPSPFDGTPPLIITVPDSDVPILRPDGNRPIIDDSVLYQKEDATDILERSGYTCNDGDDLFYPPPALAPSLTLIIDVNPLNDDLESFCNVRFFDEYDCFYCGESWDDGPCPCTQVGRRNAKKNPLRLIWKKLTPLSGPCADSSDDGCTWASAVVEALNLDTECECVAEP